MAAWVNKWFSFSGIVATLLFAFGNPTLSETKSFPQQGVGGLHPFHVSVVEINHNSGEKSLEISCKIFTDDFEKILAKNYKAKVDLINPPSHAAMDSFVKKYLLSHLSIQVNGKPVSFSYLGFEHEGEAVYGYIEAGGITAVSKVEITTNIMYDLFDDQMNIFHVTVNGKRKSTKLNYPDKTASLEF
jgi:hypothetical protein